jgi:hypothetical protein
MNVSTASECPSHFALDDREIHEGDDVEVARHVAGCPRCQQRLAQRAAERARFDGHAPAIWTGIAAAAGERRSRRWRVVGLRLPALVLGLGAVALWVVVARRLDPRPDSSYLAPKGRAPVEIVCRRGGAVFLLAPGDQVAPGDELRFRPLPVWREGRFIQVGSVDGTGRYTPFYPAAPGAPSLPLPGDSAALEGSIRLDAAPGPERVFVVVSAAPLSETAVAEAAEAQATAGATVDRIQGAPVHSAWIVLPKRAEAARAP